MRGRRSAGKQCDAADWAGIRDLSWRADHFATASGYARHDHVFIRCFGITVIDLSQNPLSGDTSLRALEPALPELEHPSSRGGVSCLVLALARWAFWRALLSGTLARAARPCGSPCACRGSIAPASNFAALVFTISADARTQRNYSVISPSPR